MPSLVGSEMCIRDSLWIISKFPFIPTVFSTSRLKLYSFCHIPIYSHPILPHPDYKAWFILQHSYLSPSLFCHILVKTLSVLPNFHLTPPLFAMSCWILKRTLMGTGHFKEGLIIGTWYFEPRVFNGNLIIGILNRVLKGTWYLEPVRPF